jgi:hypothetical protein
MKRLRFVAVALFIAGLSARPVQAESAVNAVGNLKACEAVLAKDLYAYAQWANLQEDFLRYVDREQWEVLRTERAGRGSVNVLGIADLSFADSYDQFDKENPISGTATVPAIATGGDEHPDAGHRGSGIRGL